MEYEGESISNQPIDQDGHDFHALFQYIFYTWVQNCTLIESFFYKILNAVNQYLYLKGKSGKEMHELADVYGSCTILCSG